MFDYTQVPSLIGQWSSHCGFLVNIYIFLDLYRDFLNFPWIFFHRKRNWRLRMNTFKEYRHRIVLYTYIHRIVYTEFFKIFLFDISEKKTNKRRLWTIIFIKFVQTSLDAYERSSCLQFSVRFFKRKRSKPMNDHFYRISNFSKFFSSIFLKKKTIKRRLWTILYFLSDIFRKKANEGRLIFIVF